MRDIPLPQRAAFIRERAGELVDRSGIERSAPIVHPVKDILCVGLNYLDHAAEAAAIGLKEGEWETVYFSKRCDYIRGDGEAIVIRDDLDYEVELAVVIGKGGRGIGTGDTLFHVFGYSIGNDLSSRRLQRRHNQWFLGKSLDGYTAMGPCILLNEDGAHRDFTLSARVNGELRQSSHTSLMIRGVEELVSELSRAVTLVPGDILFTGTPAGVGAGSVPPRFLRAGDNVELEIEGIGRLVNTVSAR